MERTLSLCSWCRWGHTLPTDENGEAETWCSSNLFEAKGENNWPDIQKCEEYELDKNVSLVDLEWFKISYAAEEVNRLEIKKTILNN